MHQAPPLKRGRHTGVARQIAGRRWQSAFVVCGAVAGLVAMGEPAVATVAPPNSFRITNLVANKASFHPKLVDPNLKNAWGLAAGPGVPLWVSDNNSAFATVYGGGVKGSPVTLDLTVPVPGGNPTGQVFNSDTKAFHVGSSAGASAVFIVATDSVGSSQSPGEIAAWNGGAKFVVEDRTTGGPGGKIPNMAVFKGLAIAASTKAGPELFAADVANASVDVFSSSFHLVKTPTEFRDPKIPAGYAPFGIQNLGGKIYVAYGKQNKQKTDVLLGSGLGYVDVYSVDGKLIHHLINGGKTSPLNAPWGLVIAPEKFGRFGGDLLVGNLGNGWINAFNPTTGKFLGPLRNNSLGYPIAINGLWGLKVGNSAFGGASSVIFSAGPTGYADGRVGIINPAG